MTSNTKIQEDILSPQKRLQYLFDQGFPKSLEALGQRNDNLTKVIQKFESAYISAGSDISKQYMVKEEAKKALVMALSGACSDINTLANTIEHCVKIETNAVESLILDIDIIQQRILIAKENHSKQRYSQLLGPIPEASHVATRIIAEDRPRERYISSETTR